VKTYDHAAALRAGTDYATGWRRRQLKRLKDHALSGPYYEQPPLHGQPERGSFRLPRDVFAALGHGDLQAGGRVAAHMFSVAAGDDPTIVHADVVRDVGHGSLAAGRRVLERFVQQVSHRGAQPRIEQPDGHSPDRVITGRAR
jgi:hypothetical protein